MLPEKHDYWKAIDYQNLQFARKRPWDRLNPDGLKKGEVQQKDFVDGVGVGETFYAFMAAHLKLKAFGGDSDDTISFRQEIKNQYRNGVLCVRYQTVNESENVVFATAYGDITFEKTSTTRIAFLELGQLEPGVFQYCGAGEYPRNNRDADKAKCHSGYRRNWTHYKIPLSLSRERDWFDHFQSPRTQENLAFRLH